MRVREAQNDNALGMLPEVSSRHLDAESKAKIFVILFSLKASEWDIRTCG